MSNFTIYILNIFLVALPLAIFEIIIERDKGWGSGWQKSKWYAKPFAPSSKTVKFLAKILNIEPPLNYHIVVFGLVLPSIFLCQYLYVTSNVVLLLACFVAVTVFEDFLWFLLNWHFTSLRQLFKGPHGTIWWHKRWIRVFKNYYLPGAYFTAVPLSIILLLLA